MNSEFIIKVWLSQFHFLLLRFIIKLLQYNFNIISDKIDPLPFENKLPVFDRLLSEQPARSRFIKFVADAPTTTLQRLKGITTGSLPTFIDIGSNFATPEINEDNIIDQVNNNKFYVLYQVLILFISDTFSWYEII